MMEVVDQPCRYYNKKVREWYIRIGYSKRGVRGLSQEALRSRSG